MKISRDRFEEILSSYLDGEASSEELELLAKCVRDDPRMSNIYYKACRVHAATCAMYGKKAVFIRLNGVIPPNFTRANQSKIRVALEWAVVVGLMVLSASLMWVAIETAQYDFNKGDIIANSAEKPINLSSYPRENDISYATEIAESAVETSSVYSVIKIKVFAPFAISK